MTTPPPSRRSLPLRTNRKLRQRRPISAHLPALRDIGHSFSTGARRVAPWALGITVIALLVLLGSIVRSWALSSPRFALKDVVVAGNARVTREEILRLAGLLPGTNIFAIALDEVERDVGANSWVAEVTAVRRLPDRIAIKVTERTAAALVLLEAPYLADADGEIFRRARTDTGEADGPIIVTGIGRELWLREPTVGSAIVREAIRTAELWRSVGDRPDVGEIHVAYAGLTLFARDIGTLFAVIKKTIKPSTR